MARRLLASLLFVTLIGGGGVAPAGLAAGRPAPAPARSAPRPDRTAALTRRVTAQLSDELRRPRYRGNPNRLAGHCYVASEALYHLLGGKQAGWTPMFVRHEGEPHWFLRNERRGLVIDPTAGQFRTPVPVAQARGKGFLTAAPSRRAAELIRRVLAAP